MPLSPSPEQSYRPGLRVVTPKWVRERQAEVTALHEARRGQTTTLLIVAAQHPLVDGVSPGKEFTERLKTARDRYDELTLDGRQVALYLSGNRHHDAKSCQSDKVALYDAAGLWLLEHGIPGDALHGKDWIDVYQPSGVYNGALELKTAAAGFRDNPAYVDAEYICSPGQATRAKMYALAHTLPLKIGVPESLEQDQTGQFHSNTLQQTALTSLAKSIDPYGEGLLAKISHSRLPQDGNLGTVEELLSDYAELPWYQ